MKIESVLRASSIAWRLALASALVSFALFWGISAYWAARLPDRVSMEFSGRADAVEALLRASAADLQDRLDAESAAWRDMVDRRLAAFERTADGRLAAIQADARAQIQAAVARADERIGEAVLEIRGVRADLKPVIASTDELLMQSSSTVAVVRPQLLGLMAAAKVTAGETATAMRDIRRATPEFIRTAQQFGHDSSSVAANLNRLTKPRWYDRLLGYTLNGVVIWRNLNPATNIAVKSTEAISSKP